jgi:hypothetical protein
MEKINLEGYHVPWPDGGLECTWPLLEPMKLTHLVKICGICQANSVTTQGKLLAASALSHQKD